MRRWLSTLAALLCFVRAGLGLPATEAKLLVGLWRMDDEEVGHSVILRRANGTFLEKVYRLYDLSKPPIDYTASGSWRVRGEIYIERLEKISVEVWSKKQAGRTFKMEIRQVDRHSFKYISGDNANVEEHRIGDASDAAFAQTSVEPPEPPEKEIRRAQPVLP